MVRRTAAHAEILARYIEQRGLKSTRQRHVILEALMREKGHVSIEELLAKVRLEDPRVSTATLYRTMKLLTECGLANAQQFKDGQTRYEACAGREHHDHLICTRCGAIVEFEDDRIEEIQQSVARDHGFQLEHHRLELYGVCRSCSRASRRSRPAA